MSVKLQLIITTGLIAFGNSSTSTTPTTDTSTVPWDYERYYEVNHGCDYGPYCSTLADKCDFSEWGTWSNCTDVCKPFAQKTRTRTCLTDTCTSGICTSDYTSQTVTCSELPCCEGLPRWTAWNPWNTPCGSTCRLKEHFRTRRCLSCTPTDQCEDSFIQYEDCPDPCPLICVENATWTSWSIWTTLQSQVIRRNALARFPRTRAKQCRTEDCRDGSPCVGLFNQTENYIKSDCSASWMWWGAWGTCDSTICNVLGKRTRTRICRPWNTACLKGVECKGYNEESRPCVNSCCDVGSPSWTQWTDWTDCSCSCGHGIQTRKRRCKGSKECLAETSCVGEWKEKKFCFTWCCKKVKLGPWHQWSECKKACGGISRRRRKCRAKKCSLEKEQCKTMKIETRACPKCI